jgi:alkaline phosphatase
MTTSAFVLQVLLTMTAAPPDATTPSPAESTATATATKVLPSPLAPVGPHEPILIGSGDIADCNSPGDEATALLVERMLNASDGATAFTAGDNVYPDGTLSQYRRCYEPSWGRFKSRTLPSVGNHDHRTKNAAGARATFAGRFTQDGPLWYAADVKGNVGDENIRWRAIILDSNCDIVDCTQKGPQYAWLKDELRRQKAAGTRCTVAIFHHPRFSSGPHGDAPQMQALWELMDDAGVDLVVSGHDHIYERFAPLDGGGNVRAGHGMTSIVAGLGGKSRYPTGFTRKHSTGLRNDVDGVLVLRLRADGWTSALWTTTGEAHDVATGRCR